MTYSLRLLTPSRRIPAIHQLQQDINIAWPHASLIPEAPARHPWEQILVRLRTIGDLGLVCRVPLTGEPRAIARRQKLIQDMQQGRPLSAVRWLQRYMDKSLYLYEIHPTEEVQVLHGWETLLSLRLALWEQVRGIFHTRDEGFTNPAGDLILWEYPPSATGTVPAAVYHAGRFRSFSLNLASPAQRNAFLKGKKPPAKP
ncbi:hypothetical protein OOT00_11595 [Desulfobotulus sp. H1]|uniref:Uncharacterized protein n=1 Tax=Desulfobotulus pelophilus TaxID=2823377 RepID=A0ABT3NAY3_9BACT|nr:hypothetical protein [Desulfobotulus pelophilus]MCW7754628.1 hypothetical protein [Desulfobotulus pelophilus]